MRHTRKSFLLSLCLGLACVLGISTSAMAQQNFTKVKRLVVADVEESEQLSAELQRELEQGNALPADPDCGDDCAPSPGAQLKAPGDGGGSTRYTCKNGNCACSGACDCVVMEDVCMPDTIGCSDYGCSCKDNPGAEHPEPNC